MKVAILTQPLTNNYGGILQNFAMQEALRRKGHDVVTLNVCRRIYGRTIDLHYFLSIAKRLVQKYIQHDPTIIFLEAYKQTAFGDTPQPFQQRFFKENLNLEMVSPSGLTAENDKYEAYIVGSDQVWRPIFSPCLQNYYLDFVGNPEAKRIAYAASFGVNHWEADEKTTEKIATLAKKFNAISVREHSGLKLCKENLGVEAVQMLDPTMLLEAEDYRKIYQKHPSQEGNEPYIATYVLDRNPEIQGVIQSVSKAFGMPTRRIGKYQKEGFDSLESWLEGIDKAKYVITDSFHGCVFSMLFGKQFVALGNKSRGMTRFEDLFSQFEVPERLVSSHDEAMKSLQIPIDYEKVYEIMNAKRLLSNKFIDCNLK